MSIQSQCERIVKSAVAKAKFLTRWTPDRLAVAVSQLTDEQRVAACQMGFGSLLQLNRGKLKMKLCG
ncbi:hypothetical protein WN943_022843 [Citrus x changshan-huyou]